jgi:hypothetical protein
MRFFDWLLRRKPKGRRKSTAFRGSEAEKIIATKAVINTVATGDGPAAGRFPKLSDSSPEVLTQTPNSATVAKDGPQPAKNIWDLEDPSGDLLAPAAQPGTQARGVGRPAPRPGFWGSSRNRRRWFHFSTKAEWMNLATQAARPASSSSRRAG